MTEEKKEPFEVIDYDSEKLAHLFHHQDHNSPLTIREKYHITYLEEYLGEISGLNAKYVVIENQYISKDYLSDYSNYYSACFTPYPKICKRLHFFTGEYGNANAFEEIFERVILEGVDRNKLFWLNDYLGYIVINPIPNSVIGFTLLKHYNFNENNKRFDKNRNYWGIKEYKIHIFGNEVKIPSLAFQEQDQALAACATIAIWSMLQRAAEDYYVILKSPGEITKDTGITSHEGNRLFPNKGLVIPDMCRAITKNGLVTEVRYIAEIEKGMFNLHLRKLINAYSPLKIPIILCIDVPVKGEYYGHAVAVCGHRVEDNFDNNQNNSIFSKILNILNISKTKINWSAERINKFYVHDDQWGPFCRMKFAETDKLSCPWTEYTSETELTKIVAAIIPVFPKVRISYEDIETVVVGINNILINSFEKDEVRDSIEWDIKLHLSEDLKLKIQQSEIFDDSVEGDRQYKLKFISLSLPKYIWVATFKINNQEVMDFVFDATGLSGSMLGLAILNYYEHIPQRLEEKFNKNFESLRMQMTEDETFLSIEYLNFIQKKITEFSFASTN